MRGDVASLLLLAFMLLATGCEQEPDDSATNQNPSSTFPAEDANARFLAGRVLRGTEPVVGAVVRVDPKSGFGNEPPPDLVPRAEWTLQTDSGGRYRIPFPGLSYDLSVREDREVAVFLGVSSRWFEPSIGEDGPLVGFSARVLATTDPPPAAGHSLAFIAEANEVRGLRDDSGTLVATFSRYESTLTLRAIEYETLGGLASPVRSGAAKVNVRHGELATILVPTSEVGSGDRGEVVFAVDAPPGMTVRALDVTMDYWLRRSERFVAKVAPGVALPIRFVSGMRYNVRAYADGPNGTSDSGRVQIDPTFEMVDVPDPALAPEDDPYRDLAPISEPPEAPPGRRFVTRRIKLSLPRPLSMESPVDDTAASSSQAPPLVDASKVPFAVQSARGVLEHVISPETAGGSTIRVITTSREMALPDVTRFGLPRPTGAYTWRVQHWPDGYRIENFGGSDARIGTRSWTSPRRAIVLQ